MTLDTPLSDRFEARLIFLPLQGPARVIRRRYIRSSKNPTATAWAAMGMRPGGRYSIQLQRVTPRQLGMVEINAGVA